MNKWLIAALVVIVGAIVFLEMGKVGMLGQTRVEPLALSDNSSRIASKAQMYSPAVEIVDPEGFINVEEGFRLADVIGKKVVLIDFWTYSCINCQRTLPYLTAWHERYEDEGLVIVGVHTPEFAFEEEYENVVRATQKWGVEYPVVQDNDYQTWRAYKNRYWPRKYLIDIDGFIVYDHIGEGGYEETEDKIRELLDERARVLGLDVALEERVDVDVVAPRPGVMRTPELYFGYGFARGQLGNSEGWHPGEIVEYRAPAVQQEDLFYLDGAWLNERDYMEAVSPGVVALRYSARQVNIVAGAEVPADVEVVLDGEVVDTVSVGAFDLYTVVDLPEYGEHDLVLRVPEGVRLYTFTFG